VDANQDLLRQLRAMTGLEDALLEKILREIQAWYARDLHDWIRDRHRDLQRQGMRNQEIFSRLREEMDQILVRPPRLSERQIRRVIYG